MVGSAFEAPSRFNLHAWEKALADHPNRKRVEESLRGITHGLSKHHQGPLPTYKCRNLPMTVEDKIKLADYVITECKLGRMFGPFIDEGPFMYRGQRAVCVPAGSVVKDVDGRRLVNHFSFPRNGLSINDGIPDEFASLSLPQFLDVVSMVFSMGPNAFLWKLDWKSAYRQVMVRREDRHLQGLHFEGFRFIDCYQPFGSRESGYNFDEGYAKLFAWILIHERPDLFSWRNIKWVLNFIDDFFGGHPVQRHATEQLQYALQRAQELGIIIKPSKVRPPATSQDLLGLVYDTRKQEVSVPLLKVSRYLRDVRSIIDGSLKSCTKQFLESLYGRLLYASHIVRPGKAFLMRLYRLKECKKHMNQIIDLSHSRKTVAAALADLRWWSTNFMRSNKLSFRQALGLLPRFEVWTDASGTLGIGGVSRQRFFSVPWTLLPIPVVRGKQDIHWGELLAVIAAIYLWGGCWSGGSVHRSSIPLDAGRGPLTFNR